MRVVAVPCLSDNYAYLVISAAGRAAIVDPGEAAPILEAVAREGVTLAAIWATHHHPDHVGGNKALLAAFPDLEVVASAVDGAKIAGVTRKVGDGDEVTLDEVRARIISNPGHTLGAISFWIEDAPAVFTGDTLFAAGCGRMFEGDAPMFHTSLQKLAALPPATRVYFGHEYTASNLRFAAHTEPDHAPIADRIAAVAATRARGETTTPSTIADELATNPFLRVADAAAFAARRSAKDSFK
jgi:hydroxyacylglutathione hydrolase